MWLCLIQFSVSWNLSAVGATIMRGVYGIEVLDKDDKYIKIAEEVAESLTSMAPGKYLVDSIPIRMLQLCH